MSSIFGILNKMTRRQFLKTAVLGAGTVSLSRVIRSVDQSQADDYEVYGGYLAGKGETWIEIQQLDQLRHLTVDSTSNFWKGGAAYLNSFVLGDEVIDRARLENNLVLKAWANLTRCRGIVDREAKSGYVIKTKNHANEKEILLAITENTLIGNPDIDLTPSQKKASDFLKINDFVDIIGESTQDGILVTTIISRPIETTKGAPYRQKEIQYTPGISYQVGPDTIWLYTGHSNWFDCATGGGGCWTCNISYSNQTAYPSTGTCRESCGGSCCDCTLGCYSMVFKICGNSEVVKDRCVSKERTVYIVDCGPHVTEYCSQGCGYPNCSNLAPPIIDLTKPTFTYFRDPEAGWCCFSCNVQVTV